MRTLVFSVFLLAAGTAAASPVSSFVVEGEAGPLGILVNDGNYGANGTLYHAADVGQTKNLVVSKRLSAEAWFGRHGLVLLYAPLDVTTRMRLERPIVFRDEAFATGTVVDHRYLFDGYRASYLYGVVRSPRWSLDVGGSLQVRNADVAFTSIPDGRYTDEHDIGLVPALKGRATYTLDSGVFAMLEADGLSTFGLGTKGSILDAALTLGAPVTSGLSPFVRLRVLGGGAEVEKRAIYNHAWFVSATAGVRADLVELFGH